MAHHSVYFLSENEGWAEYRHLDFGVLAACADGALQGDGSVPTCFTYSLDEQTLNNASWPLANGG